MPLQMKAVLWAALLLGLVAVAAAGGLAGPAIVNGRQADGPGRRVCVLRACMPGAPCTLACIVARKVFIAHDFSSRA